MSEKRITELKELIAKSGLSIAKTARKADISNQTLYNFLLGKSDLNLNSYDKIVAVLNENIKE